MPDTYEQALAAEAAGIDHEAERLVRELLEAEPEHVGATVLAATLAGKSGNLPLAENLLRKALSFDPNSTAALDRLASLLRHTGRVNEAINLCLRSLAIDASRADVHENLGRCYLATQQLALAEAALRRATELAPTRGIHFHHLGSSQFLQGKNSEAIASFREALRLDRTLAQTYLRLAQLLIAQGERQEAIDLCSEALEREPGLADAHVLWAEALQELGRLEEAESHLRQATTIDPKISVQQGARLQVLGRFEEATACFERALSIRPQEAAAYGGLVRSRKLTVGDRPLIDRMLALIPDPRLTPADRIALHYALGKAFDDLGEFGAAMRHFNEANGIAASHLNLRFDEKILAGNNDLRIKTYGRETFAAHEGLGSRSTTPIFIVGMIRSGTTLVEQALSSHPQIGAAGELRFWSEREPELSKRLREGRLPANVVEETAGAYLALLDAIAPGKTHVTDKMPLNFAWLGLIHLIFPEAPIVHCRRNPIDNCLSIYTTLFDSSPPFAHVPANIVAYYRQYERLMEHWQRTFSKGTILDVRYEEMVSDREATLRRILEHCRVPWDDACLSHEKNTRAVRTPSMWQVRQPIYATSVERWRRYEPWLGEFAKMLAV